MLTINPVRRLSSWLPGLLLLVLLGQGSIGAAQPVDFATPLAAFKEGDYDRALPGLRQLSRQGYAAADALLGVAYLEGLGIDPDDRTAAIWFYRAASRNVASAQLRLALLHMEGRGVSKDKTRAYGWLLIARTQGEAEIRDRAAELLMEVATQLSQNDVQRAESWASSWRPAGPQIPR